MRFSVVRSGGLACAAAALFLVGATQALAQTGSVRGQVTAQVTERPMAGAQVTIAGTGLGGIVNSRGEYVIANVPVGTHEVQVQMLGYRTARQEVTVSSANEVVEANFALGQQALGLDAIVVTGQAQETQRRAIGNSVSAIDAEGITDLAPIQNLQELLGARSPGLTVLSNSGQAGASSRIRIRGAGSLTAGLEPVVYIDGVRMMSGFQSGFSTGNGVVQATSALDAVNPNDIESIEVIKGPAAATLYGADAAGGVIQIITKKGRAGQGIQWTVSAEAGETEWTLPKPDNFWMCTPANIANAQLFPGCQGLDPAAPAAQRLMVDNPLVRDPAALRVGDLWGTNISGRGGGQSYNYFLSFEHRKEEGVFFNNNSNRTQGRANFGFVPSEQFRFNVNVGYSRTDVMMPWNNNSSNGVLRNAMRGRTLAAAAPWEPGWRGLPASVANDMNNRIETERVTLGITGNWSPFSWLENRLTLGMDRNDRVNQLFFPIDRTGRQPFGANAAEGENNRFLPLTHLWTVDYAGSVNTQLTDEISSSFSMGMQLNRRQFESHTVQGRGLVANKLNLVSAAAITSAGQSREEQTSLGFFVQEQVGWKDRLFVTGAVRIDDNSAFGNNFSLVVYPKASVSYVISDEDFFDYHWVDDLKLRVAWGQAGNAPAPFTADRTFEAATTTFADVSVSQLTASSFGNENLKAETGQELEVGFDAAFLEGRAGLEFTYYNQQTKDALISVPDPRSLGFDGNHFINIGEVRNSGFELALTGSPIYRRNIQWDASLGLSTNSNELVTFGGVRDEITFGSFASVQRHREGYPLGAFWAVDVERDAQGNPVLDASGNATVDFDNEIFVGPSVPTREINFTNDFTVFGNLRFFTHLDYKGGNYQWCAICSIRSRIDQNHWEVNDPDASPEQVAVWTSLQTLTHILPADFVKLREVSATYTLPVDWAQRFGASQASLTLAGRNLGMWTRYKPYRGEKADPEVRFNSQSSFNELDYASAPMMRRLLATVRFTF